MALPNTVTFSNFGVYGDITVDSSLTLKDFTYNTPDGFESGNVIVHPESGYTSYVQNVLLDGDYSFNAKLAILSWHVPHLPQLSPFLFGA